MGGQQSERELIKAHINGQRLVTIDASAPVSKAVDLMTEHGISQIPVVENDVFIGSITDQALFNQVIAKPELKEAEVRELMSAAFPELEPGSTMADISKALGNGQAAVMVREGEKAALFTKQDVINAMA